MSLLLAALLTFADPHLHGFVRDASTHEPIAGASVRVIGTRLGAYTDIQGEFHLHDVRGDSVMLEVTSIGYQAMRRMVSTSGEQHVVVDLTPKSLDAEAVVVVAPLTKPSTQNETRISNEQMAGTRSSTLATSLESVPGVSVIQTGPSIAKPVIQGMSGARVAVIQAGTVQESQQWGDEHAPEIDPFMPATYTVVKGASSLRIGPSAIGGAINVEPLTIDNTTQRTRGEVSTNLFANNLQGSIGAWIEQTQLFDELVGVRLFANERKAGNASTADYVLGNTAFQTWSAGLASSIGTDDLGVDVYGSLFSTKLGIFQGSHIGNPTDLQRAIDAGHPRKTYEFSYDIDRPYQDVTHALFTATGHYRTGEQSMMQLTYSYQQNNRSEFDQHGRGVSDGLPAMSLRLTTYNVTALFEHSLFKGSSGEVGVTGLRQVNSRGGLVYLVPDYTMLGLGGWIVENVSFDNVTLSGGLRYDYRQLDVGVTTRLVNEPVKQFKTFIGLAANLGAAWQASTHVIFLANASLNWRPPQINELYSNDVHHGVARYEVGDSLLNTERATHVDVTANIAVPGFEAQVMAHATRFDGYIYSVPVPDMPTVTIRGSFPTFLFQQNNALIAGFDASATADLFHFLSLYARGSLVYGEDLDNNIPLIFMPANRVRFGTHAHTHDIAGIHDGFVDVSVNLVAEQHRAVNGQDLAPAPDGYALIDLSVGGSFDVGVNNVRFSLSVLNVLNTSYRDYLSRYRYFADDIGRDIIFRFTIPFGDVR